MNVDRARLAVRHAVRGGLADLDADALVLVGCSGGADSLALARAVAAERGRVGAIIIDHCLQPGSAEVAAAAAAHCRDLGLDPVEVIEVSAAAEPGAGGPEAVARDARRSALLEAAQRLGAEAILLAHTRDDQAETVLLRLARGSGARSLSAMAPIVGLWRRPLLGLDRATVQASVADLSTWSDPHNADPRFARVRVRRDALPALTEALGPGVIDGLARSAELLRDDADALDELAGELLQECRVTEPDRGSDLSLDIGLLAAAPRAVRTRVLRRAAIESGAIAAALTRDHITSVEALISDWHGQGPVDLPGALRASRRCGRLHLDRSEPLGSHPRA